MFYLVQNLVRKARPQDEPSPLAPTRSAAGRFDDLFGCEYMGSSEFEYGAIPEAFRRMSEHRLQITPLELVRDDVRRVVFIIASPDMEAYAHCEDERTGEGFTCFEDILREFERWFTQSRLHTMEVTYFDDRFASSTPDQPALDDVDTVAWWAIDSNVAWTLNETIAQELLGAFSPASVPASNA